MREHRQSFRQLGLDDYYDEDEKYLPCVHDFFLMICVVDFDCPCYYHYCY